jgi:cytidylate kinase
MIIWVDGPFGAGKTTLVEELSKRLGTAVTVDPELLGFVLKRMVPPAPTGDFQDLRSSAG